MPGAGDTKIDKDPDLSGQYIVWWARDYCLHLTGKETKAQKVKLYA